MNKNFVILVLALVIIACGSGLYVMNKKLEASNTAFASLQAELNAMIQKEAETQPVAPASAQNPAPDTVSIGDADNGKTLSLVVGQKLSVTITEVGSDGGYQFQNPDYDTSLMHLDTHSIVPVADSTQGAVGSSPSGTWTFTALKAGATDLTIVTARAGDPTNYPNQYKVSLSIK